MKVNKPAVLERESNTREPHMLDAIQITPDPDSWEVFQRDWIQPMTFGARRAMIHALRKPIGNGLEPFCFLLNVADRYGAGSGAFLTDLSEGHIQRSAEHWRLANEALATLAQCYFKKQGDGSRTFEFWLPYNEPLFSKLLWFFRNQPFFVGGYNNLRPINTGALAKDDGKHYINLMEEFVREFARNTFHFLNRSSFGARTPEQEDCIQVVAQKPKEILDLMVLLGLLGEVALGTVTKKVFDFMLRTVLHKYNVKFTPPFASRPVQKMVDGLLRQHSDDETVKFLHKHRVMVYR